MPAETPLIRQYQQIKKDHQDAVLLFRLGDFYEMFYDDAVVASRILGLVLTSRSNGRSQKVPMAGVPAKAIENYLTKLLRAGKKVAICEQVEDPKVAKGIVKRKVVEVVTPGTVLSDGLLERNRNNYLASVFWKDNNICGISHVDLSTGEFYATELPMASVPEELKRIDPAELILPQSLEDNISPDKKKTAIPGQASASAGGGSNSFLDIVRSIHLTFRDDWLFSFDNAIKTLKAHFQVASLDGFGCGNYREGVSAAGVLLSYIMEIQPDSVHHIHRIKPYSLDNFMQLDETTIRNLELFMPMMTGARGRTLLEVLDKTVTAMGGRLIGRILSQPLISVEAIKHRQAGVAELVEKGTLRTYLIDELKKVHDIERLMGKIASAKANPRDLIFLKTSLVIIPEIRKLLTDAGSNILIEMSSNLNEFPAVIERIETAIVDDPPISLTEGNIIRKGYDEELDRLRKISTEGKDWIARLQAEERRKTGISSLKVGYNKVFGYYIEVTKPNLHLVPGTYVRKQTLTNGERYITQELKEYESEVLGAEERIFTIEYDLFTKLRQEIASYSSELQAVSNLIARLDALTSLAAIAVEMNYCKPEVDDGTEITITDCRHPVVEFMMTAENFVPNDVHLDTDKEQIIILTGPNMAGKSTYLRQIGLIVLMAQIGSFVPARSAKIGVVDRVFTRVGASDNLAMGQSTFLVEMNETANILNNATSKSLILLDEIGRGTSTFDGLSIAWAVTEFLHEHRDVGAKTIFATHYHELTELAEFLPRVVNYNVLVKEWKDEIVFLRKVEKGGSDRSYGIQVARIAGLPQDVIDRAKEVLHNLESGEFSAEHMPKLAAGSHLPKSVDQSQLSLFALPEENPVLEEIKKANIEKMSPIDALNFLNGIKKKLNE